MKTTSIWKKNKEKKEWLTKETKQIRHFIVLA